MRGCNGLPSFQDTSNEYSNSWDIVVKIKLIDSDLRIQIYFEKRGVFQ